MKKRIGRDIKYDNIKGFHRLPSSSEEYLKAKYLMELHLGTFEIETFNIWKIENKPLEVLYEDYCDQDTVTKVGFYS